MFLSVKKEETRKKRKREQRKTGGKQNELKSETKNQTHKRSRNVVRFSSRPCASNTNIITRVYCQNTLDSDPSVTRKP